MPPSSLRRQNALIHVYKNIELTFKTSTKINETSHLLTRRKWIEILLQDVHGRKWRRHFPHSVTVEFHPEHVQQRRQKISISYAWYM